MFTTPRAPGAVYDRGAFGAPPAGPAGSGALVSYEEYHPFGTTSWWAESSTIQVSRKRYRYTGKEKDEETGLCYHGARYLMPWLARWERADPAGMVDGPNRYAYVRGNPVGGRDPTGLGTVGGDAHLRKVTPEEGADPDFDLDDVEYTEDEAANDAIRIQGMGQAHDVSVLEALGVHEAVGAAVGSYLDSRYGVLPRALLLVTPEPVLEAVEAAANSKAAKVLEDAAVVNLLALPAKAAVGVAVSRARPAVLAAQIEVSEGALVGQGAVDVGVRQATLDTRRLLADPDAHTLARHGGSVTDAQLATRARTGVAPDGSVKIGKHGDPILPPYSTAFHTDELAVLADEILRGAPLAEAVAANPAASVLTITGNTGLDLGRGFSRIGGARFRGESGPLQLHAGITSARGAYRLDATGRWNPITLFPEP